MTTSASQFNQTLVPAITTVTAEAQALETWAGNKIDASPTFDFTTAQSNLNAAVQAFVTAVAAIAAL